MWLWIWLESSFKSKTEAAKNNAQMLMWMSGVVDAGIGSSKALISRDDIVGKVIEIL